MRNLIIRNALEKDLCAIKMLADANKAELGFVLLPVLQEAITEGRIVTAVVNTKVVGFLHFRHRKDRLTKIYQICVDSRYRLHHYGSSLIGFVENLARERNQLGLCLACPQDLGANSFYRRLGFSVREINPGKLRALVIWHRLVKGVSEEA